MSWFSKSVKLEGESVSATEKPIIKSKLKRNREIKIAGLTCCLLGVVCFFLLHKLHNIHPFILSIHTEIWTQGKTQPIHACRQGFSLRAFTYACKKTEKKLFCMQNRQVLPVCTERRWQFSSAKVEERLSGKYAELLLNICCFPDGAETLDVQSEPRDITE